MSDDIAKEIQSLIGFTLLGLLVCSFMIAFALADNNLEYTTIITVFLICSNWLKKSLDAFSKDKVNSASNKS